ncbi:hypothetical protein B9Z55_013019 [Caenorhabditis nigoni]|uniref:DDE-1 domain-containing protein n=1 Tax=Caenorhabditis nigoni TaxID=1611254 RepID=A0A2G5TZY4_9PELO|nr:hypothetical protein B9Z55_013019 [Caenorhabditis nigoni]
MGEKLPEMTAFKSEEPCSRYLVPILRGNHFALVHVGKLEEIYHMHVFDSLRPTHPNSSPFISKSELNKLANLLAGKDVNTKITRVPEEHASARVDTIKKRCSLVSRHVDGKISKRAVLRQSTTAQSIIDFKNNVVPRIRNQYAPDHIFNVDQTGIVLEETTKRTLAKRGTDKVFRVCQRDNPTRHSMTFNPCISADGKLTGKLFVTLYEPKPPRSFRQMVAPFTDLHVTHSTSGIMTTRLAEEWMEKCLLPSIPDRSVLLLDSWHGFDKMKVLRAVARKNLEIVTFPPRTTGQLQPLDLFFNRQLKCFLRKLQDEIRLKHNDFTISVRNNLLKVARFTQNQFQAPRFAPMIQRGFYELGIVTTRPTFDTPAEFCFDPEVGKEKCKTCTNLSFFKCAHCEETYCIKCTIDHFH